MNIKLHTKGISGSQMIEPGEAPAALFGVVLEVNGVLIEEAYKVELVFEEGFAMVRPYFTPGTVEVVHHDKESWEEFFQRMESERAERTARDGLGRSIAKLVAEDADLVKDEDIAQRLTE